MVHDRRRRRGRALRQPRGDAGRDGVLAGDEWTSRESAAVARDGRRHQDRRRPDRAGRRAAA